MRAVDSIKGPPKHPPKFRRNLDGPTGQAEVKKEPHKIISISRGKRKSEVPKKVRRVSVFQSLKMKQEEEKKTIMYFVVAIITMVIFIIWAWHLINTLKIPVKKEVATQSEEQMRADLEKIRDDAKEIFGGLKEGFSAIPTSSSQQEEPKALSEEQTERLKEKV